MLSSLTTSVILCFVITYFVQEINYMVKYQKDIVSTIYKPKNIFNIQRSCDDLEMRIMISVRFDLDPSLQNINHDNF